MSYSEDVFHIVEFLGYSSVDIVPSKWVEGDCTYWPDHFKSSTTLKKAIRRSQDPERNKWKLYKIKIIHTATYEEVCCKLSRAEFDSDLQTADEDEESVIRTSNSRKRKKPSRLSYSDEDEENDEDSKKKPTTKSASTTHSEPETLPKAPTLPKLLKRQSTSQREVSLSPGSPSPPSRSPSPPSLPSLPSLPSPPHQNSPPKFTFSREETPSLLPRRSSRLREPKSTHTLEHFTDIIKAVETNTAATAENTQLLHQILRELQALRQGASGQGSSAPL